MPDILSERDEDGLPLTEVGVWGPEEKHERLKRYIDISRATRKKFLEPRKAGATYIDLFAGPGRARVRETGQIIDGSPVLALKVAREGGAPFSKLHIGDREPEYVEACKRRLEVLSAPIQHYIGPARETVEQVVAKLDRYGLHFAFLDPYDLGSLPFLIIERLAQFKHMDMLVLVNVMDLQRNLSRYIDSTECALDAFAPDWRKAIDVSQSHSAIRQQIRQHWLRLISALDMQPSGGIELVTGGKNQPLYWLVLISRHPRAHDFWEKIREVGPQRRLPL